MASSSSTRTHIFRNNTLDQWVAGLEHFDQPTERDEKRWDLVTQLFLAHAKFRTHIITSELMKSGRHETTRVGREIIGSVIFGGTPKVNYAAYEFRRGGDHDALNISFKDVQREYQKALRDILMEHVNSWK